jgi:hypothetical protein
MTRRRKQAAARAERPRDPISELRLRTDPRRERDTDPAPPPSVELPSGPWASRDRALTADVLRIEQALLGRQASRHLPRLRSVTAAIDALGDELYVTWSRTRATAAPWRVALAYAYRWACDVASQLRDALNGGDDDDIACALRSIEAYSELCVNGLVEPALQEVCEAEGEADELRAARRVRERVVDLFLELGRATSYAG